MMANSTRSFILLSLCACGENVLHSLDTSDSAAIGDQGSNQAPSAPGIRISPESPTPDDDLRCQVAQPSVDPEGQSLSYQFSWEVDGQPTDQQTDLILTDQTSADENWTCIVVASDGQRESQPGLDTVQIIHQNRAPEAPVVRISPASPGDNHGLECLVDEESVDPDGDAISYTFSWTVNGKSAEKSGSEISSEQTTQGDSWGCTVTPFDGELEGESASDSVEVGEPAYGGDTTSESGLVYDASGCSYCPDDDWYIPDKAFDDNRGNGANSWVVPWDGGPEWISVDFGTGNEKTITYYGLMGAAFHEGYRAKDWQLEGSQDESTWEVLHTVTDADLDYVMWGGEPFTYYSFSNTTAYRYYRFWVTDNMGGQPYNNEVGIVEIEMMENAPAE
jgi:hypothetical protein